MQHNSQTRFLATYVKKKLSHSLNDVKVKELEEYFDQNGWILYDMDTMKHSFQHWREQRNN